MSEKKWSALDHHCGCNKEDHAVVSQEADQYECK